MFLYKKTNALSMIVLATDKNQGRAEKTLAWFFMRKGVDLNDGCAKYKKNNLKGSRRFLQPRYGSSFIPTILWEETAEKNTGDCLLNSRHCFGQMFVQTLKWLFEMVFWRKNNTVPVDQSSQCQHEHVQLNSELDQLKKLIGDIILCLP